MNLTGATQILELITSAATALTYTVSWTDIDKTGATAVVPGSSQGNLAAAATTTIVAAPAASVYRVITSLAIKSTGGSNSVTIQKDVGGTNYPVTTATLAVNEALYYEDANGWYVLDSTGSRKGVGATGAAGTNGGGTVLGSGTSTIDFGSGAPMAELVVTGQAAILAGSLVYCWITPVATVDHTADEHRIESIKVVAGNIVAGTGFTLYAHCPDPAIAPQLSQTSLLGRSTGTGAATGAGKADRGMSTRNNRIALLTGKWSVGWFYTQ